MRHSDGSLQTPGSASPDVLHVLPSEEVLFNDLLLQYQGLGNTAGGHIADVSKLVHRSLHVKRIEVVGVILVDQCLPDDLDGGY